MLLPRRRLLRAGLIAPAASLLLPPVFAPTAALAAVDTVSEVEDWDIPSGHFYTQTAPRTAPKDSGFVISNEGGISFWRDYRALGGPAQLGYPISRRFEVDGEIYQATQVALLHWNNGRAEAEPIFRNLAEDGQDDWLLAHGIPPAAEELMEDPDLPTQTRLEWLTNPTLRSAFMAANSEESMRRFGLPMSEPQRFGPFLAQRFERAVLQLWLDNVPNQPAAGTVALVQVGDLIRQLGYIPEDALEVQIAPAARPKLEQIVPPIAGAAPTPLDEGKHIIISLSRQWWFAYEDGRLEYNGPVTTGRPELQTPLGKFTIRSRHAPYTFVSPWPAGSPFWYETATSSYALLINNDGVFLHDAPWRPYNGPGTNFPHTDPDGVWRTGSHGCINMPLAAAAWAYRWAPVGTPVDVIL